MQIWTNWEQIKDLGTNNTDVFKIRNISKYGISDCMIYNMIHRVKTTILNILHLPPSPVAFAVVKLSVNFLNERLENIGRLWYEASVDFTLIMFKLHKLCRIDRVYDVHWYVPPMQQIRFITNILMNFVCIRIRIFSVGGVARGR